ncbi:MAG: FKBP-type peptidyl-prolyl cis-trans isomerase [Chloroflexi bacterium]|nr:FKBP-type peptidyl-prolyl cis-trans isomerase [Chloroflexota bacterium]
MKKLFAFALAGALVLAACGGDDDNDAPKTPAGGATPATGGVRPSSPGSGATTAATPAATSAGATTDSDGNGPGIPPLTGDIQEATATSPYTSGPAVLRFIDEVVGTGAQPSGPSATVTVHYTGWLTDGTKFDSSVDRGTPATFQLSGVIPGWTEGVGSMKVGGKRRLIIPSDLAYGPNGRAPSIPGGATLIFDVELLEAK